jgi:hypothetical protein
MGFFVALEHLVRPLPIEMQLESTLTCPKCQHQAVETMPTDACQFFYDCEVCGARLKPLIGDCRVFCSYGSVEQAAKAISPSKAASVGGMESGVS